MAEHRVGPRGVQEVGRGLHALAGKLDLLEEGEKWVIEPGSPLYGTMWRIHATCEDRVWVPEWLEGGRPDAILGRTARESKERLLAVRDVLTWVEHMHPAFSKR